MKERIGRLFKSMVIFTEGKALHNFHVIYCVEHEKGTATFTSGIKLIFSFFSKISFKA